MLFLVEVFLDSFFFEASSVFKSRWNEGDYVIKSFFKCILFYSIPRRSDRIGAIPKPQQS